MRGVNYLKEQAEKDVEFYSYGSYGMEFEYYSSGLIHVVVRDPEGTAILNEKYQSKNEGFRHAQDAIEIDVLNTISNNLLKQAIDTSIDKWEDLKRRIDNDNLIYVADDFYSECGFCKIFKDETLHDACSNCPVRSVCASLSYHEEEMLEGNYIDEILDYLNELRERYVGYIPKYGKGDLFQSEYDGSLCAIVDIYEQEGLYKIKFFKTGSFIEVPFGRLESDFVHVGKVEYSL